MKEPIIHSHIEPNLEYGSWEDGPLESYRKYCKTCKQHGWMEKHDNFSHDSIYCDSCNEMVHLGALRNKNQMTWVETGNGNFCMQCFCDKTNYGESLRNDDELELWALKCDILPSS